VYTERRYAYDIFTPYRGSSNKNVGDRRLCAMCHGKPETSFQGGSDKGWSPFGSGSKNAPADRKFEGKVDAIASTSDAYFRV